MYKVIVILVPPPEFPEWRTISRKDSLSRVAVIGEKIDLSSNSRTRTSDAFFYPSYTVTDVVHKASPYWNDPVAIVVCLWHDFSTEEGQRLSREAEKRGWKLGKQG